MGVRSCGTQKVPGRVFVSGGYSLLYEAVGGFEKKSLMW